MEQYSLYSFNENASQNNYASQFFPNFNDTSNLQSSESSISKQSSPQRDQPQNYNDFSINEQKLKQFQMQNLIYLCETITKRIFINKWIHNKDRLKRLENVTPNNLTKVFLKIFYSISVKLQLKYSIAFRKIQRIYQQYKKSSQVQIESLKAIQERTLQTKGKERVEKIKNGCQKIHIFVMNLSTNNPLDDLKESFNSIVRFASKKQSILIICNVLNEEDENLLERGWCSIRGWINYIQKIEILDGTLNLLIHQQMRQALWIVKTQKPTLQYNDISNIQQAKSRKESMKMNSSQSLVLQRELLEPYKTYEVKNIQQISVQESHLVRKELPQLIQRNNPRHLKFTKDIKRKTQPNSIHQQLDPLQLDTIQSSHPQQSSIIKPQNEDLSMIRRGCATMNSSICQSRSIIRKFSNPLELNLTHQPAGIATKLCDEQFTALLNEGKVNKVFQNLNKVTKVKALKHQQLRKQFTDFSKNNSNLDDLFSVREIWSFYNSFKTGQERKGISLAKIKEKINTKTHEEYYSRQLLITMPDQSKTLHKVVSQTNIADLSNKMRKGAQRTYNSIKISNSQSRQRNHSNSKDKSRQKKSQIRRLKQLPKHFDYYIDKSIRRQQKPLSPQLNLNVVELKRKSISSKSKKKLRFNVVKAGTTRLSSEHQDRKKPQVEINKVNSPNKPKIDLQLKHVSRQKRKSKQPSQSPIPQNPSECEYYMAFRDPPKKKIKKNMVP